MSKVIQFTSTHSKCAFVTILALLIAQGCDDGSSSDDSDPCSACLPNQTCEDGVCKDAAPGDPCNACKPGQVCNNGACYDPSDPCSKCAQGQICNNGACYDPTDPCAKCTAQEECIDHACQPNPCAKCTAQEECVDRECKPKSEDDPCSKCTNEQVCIDNQCKAPNPGNQCDPACTDGKTCVDGRCATCIGSNCFFDGDDDEKCESDDECPEGQRCNDGECEEIQAADCDPACVDGQVCDNGTCVNSTLMWSLCRSGSDCGVGQCIFSVTPSKTTHIEVNGEIREFTTDKPIPVSILDSRINPDTYNQTHSAKAGASDDIGICAYECTKKADKTCPEGWSCQVIVKGIPDYPDNIQLPQDLPETELKDSPFAAICRRDMNEALQKDISYGIELCNDDKSKCEAAGMVFYDGMCLEPCDDDADKCPFFFSCQDAGSAKACVPDSGTCTGCYDKDEDGAGYGHCQLQGIDCDDNNPDIYYQKPLTCSDIKDNAATDLNCNGIIDKFELLGTTDNCDACGNPCNKAKSNNISVACEPVDATGLDADWRKTATIKTVAPEFACIEKCAFGYGDCKGNSTCDVALLTSKAREAEKNSDAVSILDAHVITGSNGGDVYGRDDDSDGYFPIDQNASLQSETDKTPPQIAFDPLKTMICCSNNANYCYTANKAWETVKSSETYVKLKDGCKITDPGCYDADDADKDINPEAAEICDGKDNDGSRILLKPETAPCSEWCADTANDCSSFVIKEGNTIKGYKVNPWCDSTPDGLNDPNLWEDAGDDNDPHKKYHFGEFCSIRNESNVICNDSATVTCDGSKLTCTGSDNADIPDGLDDKGNPIFNGRDDDCDGLVDEDAMIPCVISLNAAYDDIKDGVDSATSYKIYKNASGYALPLNKDGSVNLCRIGILQSKAVTEGDETTYKPICKPLYKPRTYDFYGDAFDSNCDGVDYDINHTVFVTKDDQGDLLGSDSNACRFDAAKGFVAPCATIQGAIEKAANKNADGKVVFYDDIILRQKSFTITTNPVESDGKASYALKIPTLEQQENKQTLHNYPSAGLPDEENHVKEGHVISAYKMHALLAESKRSNTAFDPNQYYFRYESVTTKTEIIGGTETTTYVYNPVAKQSEQPQPEEIVRIYGGFERTKNSTYQLPAEFDLWNQGTKQTTISWTPTIPANKPPQVYAFMQPSSQNAFSLKLDALEINVTPGGALPRDLADGATFIGIHAMVGAKILNLSNIKLTVKAPDGYSFGDKDLAATGIAGIDGKDSIASLDNSYESDYEKNRCMPSRACVDSLFLLQGRGGCGGYSTPNTNNGKPGYPRINPIMGGEGGQIGLDFDMKSSCPKIWNYQNAQGKNGSGGTPGQNGDSSKTTMAFVVDTASLPYALYVKSDRSQASGTWGIPGAGGGGGAVYSTWGEFTTAASGGNGGCGGKGGLAGGTGGSAIGIAVRSTSTAEGSTRILMDAKTKVTTHNGSGGKPQAGGAGGAGGKGGYWLANSLSLNTFGMGGSGSGGGGGAGGDGAGGLAGWTYPFVFACKHDDITKDCNAETDNLDDPACFNNQPRTLSHCGYDLPDDFTGEASRNGTQMAEATRFNDIVDTPANTAKRTGKKAANIEFGIDPYTGDSCGGEDKYRVPGGAGGTSSAIESKTTKDTSCLKDGTIPIIVQTIRE